MISISHIFEGVKRNKRVVAAINAKDNPTYPKALVLKSIKGKYGKEGRDTKYFASLAKKKGKDSKQYKAEVKNQRLQSKFDAKAEQGLINRW